MELIERLTLEAAQVDTMLASEQRQRYEFAAGLCSDRRVLDLCCGSGYGTAILAGGAREVIGVDNDAATIELAQATTGQRMPNTSFALADAAEYLRGGLLERFDVAVCFEGLEYLHELDRVLTSLREHTARGMRVIASLANSKMLGDQDSARVTEFGYEEALAAFASFPSTVMLTQFLAEGSLICPPHASEVEVKVTLEGRDEPEYANHFVFCVNFDPADLGTVIHGAVQASTSPVFNRWSKSLKEAIEALRRENSRLARARLGKSGSAAATALARLADREAEVAVLRERWRLSEARVQELERTLRRPRGGSVTSRADSQPPVVVNAPLVGQIAASAPPGEDPNSWEHRRRKAAEYLIPWIEQTVSLDGKTVLEYGCGNAAVSCAFAERAKTLIGVDIDAEAIEEGNAAVRARGLNNVKLELHPLESILDAVGEHRGEVDVFLCYAVLEHLTVAERLALLRLAREVVKPDGAIVVCETPNRLIYFDHHTAQMPFFHLLPEDLAAEYYPHSGRQDFRSALDAATPDGHAAEAIVRWGRGVSFHEFELVFGDLSQHVIGSNYDPLLFPERPVHPDEVILARYLDRWRPDLAPVWSRYWLDLILSPQPVERREQFLRPWTAQTLESARVGWSEEESLVLQGPDATLWVSLPYPTGRIVIGVVASEGATTLQVRGETEDGPVGVHIAGEERPVQRFVTFELSQPQRRLAVSASEPCTVVFVGYDD